MATEHTGMEIADQQQYQKWPVVWRWRKPISMQDASMMQTGVVWIALAMSTNGQLDGQISMANA